MKYIPDTFCNKTYFNHLLGNLYTKQTNILYSGHIFNLTGQV